MGLLGRKEHNGEQVLTLDTSMGSRAFAQSGLPKLLAEGGYRIDPQGAVFEVLPSGTFAENEEEGGTMQVFFPFFPGKSLLDTIREAPQEEAWGVLHRVLTVLAGLAGKGGREALLAEAAGRSGPLSVLAAEDGSLFVLPPTLFRRCLGSRGAQADLDDRLAWVHPDPEAAGTAGALSFLAGTLAYRTLSGTAPYRVAEPAPADRKEERPPSESLALEMRKGRREPACYAAPTFSEALCRAVDACLEPSHTAGALSLDRLLALGPALPELRDPVRIERAQSPQFIREREACLKKLDRQRRWEAFFRRHRGSLAASALAAAVVAAVGLTMASDNARKPTTEGLTAPEVAQRFYSGIAVLDQEWPDACLAKGVKTDYHDFLTTLYVTAKVRESYEHNGGILSPAHLFTLGETRGRTVFGMTGLEVSELSETRDETLFEASFYLWLPSSEGSGAGGAASADEQLSIYRYRDRIAVAPVKDRLRITRFEPQERTLLLGSGPDILSMIAGGGALAEPWAPAEDELQAARQEILGPAELR